MTMNCFIPRRINLVVMTFLFVLFCGALHSSSGGAFVNKNGYWRPMTAACRVKQPFPPQTSSKRPPRIFEGFLVLKNNKEISDDAKNDSDKENDGPTDSDALFFDDFGDFVIGDSSRDTFGSSSSPVGPLFVDQEFLKERIRETKEKELYRDTKLMKNWQRGDWSVRGFKLDATDAISQAAIESQVAQQGDIGDGNYTPIESGPPIFVTTVASDVNSEGTRIWVGRSNGSLVYVQLGTEYMTQFRSKITGKLSSPTSNDGDDGDDNQDGISAISAQFTSELVREANQQPSFANGDTLEEGKILSPFTILAQYAPATNDGSEISAILSVPDEECIFTAGKGGNGQIYQWHVSEDDIDNDTPALKTPMPLSDGIHNDVIVALKLVSYQEAQLLLSVDGSGGLALWDLKGDLVYHCKASVDEIALPEETGINYSGSDSILPSRLINCADVDGNHIFLGTASGLVLCYDVHDLLNSASSGGACPLPQGKFKAHEGGVTAIACGGPGSLGRLSGVKSAGDKKTSSSVLITGGANGVVKQWEILSSPSMRRLENWPKLPTQRLQKRAHVFEGHDGPITALETLDGKKPLFLSASTDGSVRVWDVQGKEKYRMDGFTKDISSLCVQNDLLITDGMKQYVCVHDFSIGLAGESVDDYLEQWDD